MNSTKILCYSYRATSYIPYFNQQNALIKCVFWWLKYGMKKVCLNLVKFRISAVGYRAQC